MKETSSNMLYELPGIVDSVRKSETIQPRRHRITLGIVLFLLFFGFPFQASASSSYLPKGVYALIPSSYTQIPLEVLTNPYVTGVQLRCAWADVEPVNNQFDWSYFDNLIAQAKQYNKKIGLAIHRGLVGRGLPSWYGGETFACSDGTIGPIPWDETYKLEWREVWVRMIERYDRDPAVTFYHMGGIYTWKTLDWDLCDATKGDKNRWIASGYTVEEIRTAAIEFVDALSRATHKPLILPIAGTTDNTGDVNTGINTNDYIIKPLFDRFGPTAAVPQFGIMRTVFGAYTPDPLQIYNAQDLGDQFGTLYSWRPHISGQRQGADSNSRTEFETMAAISLHYDIQLMEIGDNQVSINGIGPMLKCYNLSLGTPGAYCDHILSGVNNPPILGTIGNKTVNEGEDLSFVISATDPDPQRLIYSAGVLPPGATFDPDSRTFCWRPDFQQSGTYSVTFTVTDTGDLSDSETITITVNNVNRAPTLNPVGNKTVEEKKTLNFSIAGVDPDGDVLTYSASGLPSGAIFSATTRTFSWTPFQGQAKSYSVTFKVTDPGGFSALETIIITVTPALPSTVIRINSGGSALTDASGNIWGADRGYSGRTVVRKIITITGTTSPRLYQDMRQGAYNYQITVPNGAYKVVLKFAELNFAQAGKRKFDVKINGTSVLNNFDIVAQTGGKGRAIDREFLVNVTNGKVTIRLIAVVNNPQLNAFEIISQ